MTAKTDPIADQPVTLINVFEVPVDQAETFLAQWRERAQGMSAQPGFRDAVMYRAMSSETRFQFVNVSHWDSAEAHQEAIARPEFQAEVRAVAQDPHQHVSANPALYQAVQQYGQGHYEAAT